MIYDFTLELASNGYWAPGQFLETYLERVQTFTMGIIPIIDIWQNPEKIVWRNPAKQISHVSRFIVGFT